MQYHWKYLQMKPLRIFVLRNNITLSLLSLASFFMLFSSDIAAADFSQLAKIEQTRIAELIFNNECNKKTECLVSWNDGENFASLGIGHFIWFPKNSTAPFQESFPDLLRWFQTRDVNIPAAMSSWLTPDQAAPWSDKQDFLKPENQDHIQALRLFLAETKNEQASFIMHRLSQALPKMLSVGRNQKEKEHIRDQFSRIASSASGWYALADYVNFKGEGSKLSERYQGKGWGLAQVLLNMKGHRSGREAISSFVESASYILERRIQLSPPARNEQRWAAGWNKRLKTYLKQ